MTSRILIRSGVTLALLGALACGDAATEEEENNGGANNGPANNGAGADLTVGNPMATVMVSGSLTMDVPEGATSVIVMVEGGGGALILASKITSPAGEVVYDFENFVETNRTDAADAPYLFMLPSNPAVQLVAGQWEVEFFTDAGAPFEASVTAIYNTDGLGTTLDLNLFFVGLDGLDATTAPEHQGFQQILTNVEAIYTAAGIRFGAKNYIDVTGDDADKFAVIDSIDGAGSELRQLFALSGGHPEGALNFFFVRDIGGGDAGFQLLGLAGGVPGPPGVNGTNRSGVAVNMVDFGSADATVEIIMAHESGHYLGLYHTTERNGAGLDGNGILGQDPIGDTANCPDGADANGDKVLSAAECADHDGRNLMFWSPANDSRALSGGQGEIMQRNPTTK